MPLTQEQKKELIGKFGASDADTSWSAAGAGC